MLLTLRITLGSSKVLLSHNRFFLSGFFPPALLNLREYYQCIEGVIYIEFAFVGTLGEQAMFAIFFVFI